MDIKSATTVFPPAQAPKKRPCFLPVHGARAHRALDAEPATQYPSRSMTKVVEQMFDAAIPFAYRPTTDDHAII